MHLLEVSHLQKRYGDLLAVDDISFHVDAGEIFGLLGPNGAGKSTTMMMIAGLLPVDGGEVLLTGQPLVPEARELRATLGVVPQDLAVYPELTARENLSFFGKLYGLKGEELERRIASALERTGLTGRANSRSHEFSGGMKRRLNFGIALLHHPQLLILDEPTVGVDPQSRAHLLDCVRQLRDEGVAVIYASHYMEEVQALCDRVAIVDHGKLLACDTLRQLLSRMSADLCFRIMPAGRPIPHELQQLAEVVDTSSGDDGEFTLVVSRENDRLNETLMQITRSLNDHQIPLRAVETQDPNLERLFLDLTGRRLRD